MQYAPPRSNMRRHVLDSVPNFSTIRRTAVRETGAYWNHVVAIKGSLEAPRTSQYSATEGFKGNPHLIKNGSEKNPV